MLETSEITSKRKKEHIELCLTDEVAFKEKKNGFDNYEFLHYAITGVELSEISFSTKLFNKKIDYPFLISCMTGGTSEAENINAQLAIAADELNIPLGIGSQRQALGNEIYHQTYKIIREKAPKIPILGNIGAAQLVMMKSADPIQFLVDLIEADAMVIHVNPLQELLQKDGEPNFKGLLSSLKKINKQINVPVIIKEVGSGISDKAAEKLLDTGVKGIDVAGAGGTSWAGVEILRNKHGNQNVRLGEPSARGEFWDWGLPTSYCLKKIFPLKKKYNFTLIGSGGIYNAFDMAKAYALGADITASARIILQTLDKSGVEGVKQLIEGWFDTIRKILFLTGSKKISDLKKNKLIEKEKLY